MNRLIVTIAIVSILILSSIPIWYYFSNQAETNNSTPTSSPTVTENPFPYNKPIPLVFPSLDPGDYGETNVSQGATFQQNLTLLSKAEIQIQISLSLMLIGYNNSAYESSTPQERIFNYTFNPVVLVLNPDENQCSILTVEVANDASVGKYVLNVELGNASLTHVSGCTFSVNVNA